jgi:hypothetical protein
MRVKFFIAQARGVGVIKLFSLSLTGRKITGEFVLCKLLRLVLYFLVRARAYPCKAPRNAQFHGGGSWPNPRI